MKRFVPAVAFLLLLTAAPLFAIDTPDAKSRERQPTLIADVIRLSQAGVSDEAIISFIVHSRHQFEVTADDLIALTQGNVSNEVIKALMDESADRKNRKEERGDAPRVVVAPYWGWGWGGWGWADPYWADPFWWGPRLHVGINPGPRFGGGHRHRPAPAPSPGPGRVHRPRR